MPWTGRELVPADVADERDNWERWVPQMHAEFAGDSKRPRASPSPLLVELICTGYRRNEEKDEPKNHGTDRCFSVGLLLGRFVHKT
jgi:hypothetical protein